ncbi:DMT family transporter [Cognatishimia sp. WU-CL00825]|uniref:DMT family transporter n=1 Tax=Cognatishimia sp. WU-CL00825 TaxID=3127658 RepID=UPI00310AAFD5
MSQSNNLKGAFFAFIAFSIYSSHDVIVRYLGGIYSPIQVLFFASLMSFPLLTLMMVQDATPGTLRPLHPRWIILRSLTMVCGGLSGFYAFSSLPLAQVYSILFTVPLLITILSIPILGEKVGLHRAGAVIVGLIGVLIVVRPGSTEITPGHASAMLAAICVATQSVIARKIGKKERQIVMLLYPFAAVFIVMGASLGFVYKPMPFFDLAAMGTIAVMGFFAAFLLVGAYRAGEAAVVAPMQYIQIVWAAIFGALLFNETLDLPTIIGATVIISSGLYIVAREAFAGVSENRPVLRTRSRALSPGTFRIGFFLRRK